MDKMIINLEVGSEEIECHDVVMDNGHLTLKTYDTLTGKLNKLFSFQMRKQINCSYCNQNKLKYSFTINYNGMILEDCLVKDIKFVGAVIEKQCLEFALDFSYMDVK